VNSILLKFPGAKNQWYCPGPKGCHGGYRHAFRQVFSHDPPVLAQPAIPLWTGDGAGNTPGGAGCHGSKGTGSSLKNNQLSMASQSHKQAGAGGSDIPASAACATSGIPRVFHSAEEYRHRFRSGRRNGNLWKSRLNGSVLHIFINHPPHSASNKRKRTSRDCSLKRSGEGTHSQTLAWLVTPLSCGPEKEDGPLLSLKGLWEKVCHQNV